MRARHRAADRRPQPAKRRQRPDQRREAALGAERGRRPEFARDQHVPATVHHRTGWVGVGPGDGVAGIDATVTGAEEVQCAGTDFGGDPIICEEVQLDITSGANAGGTGTFEIYPQPGSPRFDEGDRIGGRGDGGGEASIFTF